MCVGVMSIQKREKEIYTIYKTKASECESVCVRENEGIGHNNQMQEMVFIGRGIVAVYVCCLDVDEKIQCRVVATILKCHLDVVIGIDSN